MALAHQLLSLYHLLPPSGRSLIASARGAYLREWRYGRDTERLVEEALERETWTPERWKAWEEERLALVLHRAATQVPYYREQWLARRRRGDRAPHDLLKNWPVLEKESLRRDARAFVADDCTPWRMFHEHTSGTTGTAVDLWWSRNTVRAWYALVEARCRRWSGVSRRDRWAILGGQLIKPVAERRPPFWVWNSALKQLYLSAHHLAPAWIPAYLDAMAAYGVTYLWGYSSCLHLLAQEALRQGRTDVKMKVVFTNAEPLYTHQREAIAEAFQCPVRETYGMAELVLAASECASGHLHQWPEVGHLEVLSTDNGPTRDVSGDLVGTSLLNVDMPLVRYRIGDTGVVAIRKQRCACGRMLPELGSVIGRCDDVLYTEDGRPLGRLDTVFKSQLHIREAQIIQETLGRVRVRFVRSPGTAEADRLIAERLRERMGSVDVVLEPVESIPRSRNGKFQAVVSRLSAEERRKVASR